MLNRARTAGHVPADDPRKPESPTDLHRRSWLYVVKKTFREYTTDQCPDMAAALTYFSVLSMFPAVVALVSLIGVVGDGERAASTVLDTVGEVAPAAAIDLLREPVMELAQAPAAAGIGLIAGLLGALWTASNYVSAFGRAMNRMYEVDEGRPFWKLRPLMMLVTLLGLVVAACVALILVVSGPVAEAVGSAIGIGDTALMVWDIAKWPVLLAVVVLIVAVLYYSTPNVQQPKFRWISSGAFVAIVIWIIASALFGLYIANFGNLNRTYGSLAGVIIFLLWLYITNLALLFGAELDAELERGRELQAGIKAERNIQLPPRDTRAAEKRAAKMEDDVAEGRRLREMNEKGDPQ